MNGPDLSCQAFMGLTSDEDVQGHLQKGKASRGETDAGAVLGEREFHHGVLLA